MTVNYDDAAGEFHRQVQYVVELDLPQCLNDYTDFSGPSTCTAVDAGDGMRCYRSFPTCQDEANFRQTSVTTIRFCLNAVPWSDLANPAYPLLEKFISSPEKAYNTKKLLTFPASLRFQMRADYDPQPFDQDMPLHNTATTGEFWRNLFARFRNYSGMVCRIKRGYQSLALADFTQIGPDYKLSGIIYSGASVTLKASSPLRDLDDIQVPIAVSEDNVITDGGGITSGVTTVTPNDVGEFPDPADLNVAKQHIRMDDEICEVTTRGGSTLTIVRGVAGTASASHAENTKIENVVVFDDNTVAGGPINITDAIEKLLDWLGVYANINQASFDRVETLFPGLETKRTIFKTTKISKLIGELRELRGIILFINSAGEWAINVMAPDEDTTVFTDDHFVRNSVRISESDDERKTTVVIWYAPKVDVEGGNNPDDYSKAVVVADADLLDLFDDPKPKQEVLFDPWLNPSIDSVDLRNLCRRFLARRSYGVRDITVKMDHREAATFTVGAVKTIQSRQLLGIDGTSGATVVMVMARKEVTKMLNQLDMEDISFNGRYLRIGPNTMNASYDNASAEDRAFGYWADTDNRVGTTKELGYEFW